MERWFESEVDYLASLQSRRTGSDAHNRLIDHIQRQLEKLGLCVHTDNLTFSYDDVSLRPAKLSVSGIDVVVSSAVPYSGHTGPDGVSGRLISLQSQPHPPDWSKATGAIAVVGIANPSPDWSKLLPLWPPAPAWAEGPSTAVPCAVANTLVANLQQARDAGVKAVVYTWEDISDGLAAGMYAPFHSPFFGIPALYVSGDRARRVSTAAESGEIATVTLTGQLIPDTPTRNIWVVFPGTDLPQESVIINTHTDGTNLVEENGHIALLHYAQSLVRSPPRRTTILAFITAHIHSAPFSTTKRSTTRWMADNPSLWRGTSPDDLTAVFACCVEHLGAMHYEEYLANNRYEPTGTVEQEFIYAATPELASLVYRTWREADPEITRVINPNKTPFEQPGEGLPFLHAGIPEISLITAPTWLLNEFPDDFDERSLVDIDALKRQVESLERIWREVDAMDKADLGTIRIKVGSIY